MQGVVEPLVNNDQPVVINSEGPCIEFSKCEEVQVLDDRDDKSSDTNSSLSSIIADDNGMGNEEGILFIIWLLSIFNKKIS